MADLQKLGGDLKKTLNTVASNIDQKAAKELGTKTVNAVKKEASDMKKGEKLVDSAKDVAKEIGGDAKKLVKGVMEGKKSE